MINFSNYKKELLKLESEEKSHSTTQNGTNTDII